MASWRSEGLLSTQPQYRYASTTTHTPLKERVRLAIVTGSETRTFSEYESVDAIVPDVEPTQSLESSRREDVRLTRDRRLALMERRLRDEASYEDEARLLLLTRRLRRLVPVFNDGQRQQMEGAALNLERLNQKLADMRRDLLG
jgi:hypothetical protein